MQILVNNDFNSAGVQFTQAQINSFLQDEQTAINLLTATFTNNITLTFNVGFGSYGGQILGNQNTAVAAVNTNNAIFLTYSQLRTALLTSGQPNLFTGANLPAGDSLNGISNFYISSSAAKAFGLVPNQGVPDGFVGIGTGFTPDNSRVDAFLHEFGHAMGRYDPNIVRQGVTYFSEFDLMRFVSPGQRLFADHLPSAPAYFSLDGGASRVADWGISSDPSDFLNPPASNFTPDDPFNEIVDDLGQITTADLLSTEALGFTSTLPVINPSPPAGTTAVMVLRQTSASITDGTYQIYDIGNNAILASYQLGRVGPDWRFVTLGRFNDGDSSDMLLRNSTSGAFQLYDIANNNITGSSSLGTVGLNWQVVGFGTFGSFGSFGEDDMILRDVNTGRLQVYNIDNNQITGSASLGTIGLDWQFSGIGNFSGSGSSDLLVRNSNTGGLQVYEISNNQITGSAFLGTVGLDWQFSGVGNFSGVPDESDLLLRNRSTGVLQVYNIDDNQITGSASLGAVGLDWQFAGVTSVSGASASDLVLRNVNTGAFQVYNIANNQLTGSAPLGQVGSDWQLGGFAATGPVPPPRSEDSLDSSSQPAGSTAQLVQAMAGFGAGGGAADGLNVAALGSDALQQPFLTTPQHA